eukprot:5702333-Ditylum_brightwellii.AAC.1
MEKQSGVTISCTAKYVHTVLSPLDMGVILSFKDEIMDHLKIGLGGCCTIVISLAGLMASCSPSSPILRVSKSFSTVLIPTQIHVDYRQSWRLPHKFEGGNHMMPSGRTSSNFS